MSVADEADHITRTTNPPANHLQIQSKDIKAEREREGVKKEAERQRGRGRERERPNWPFKALKICECTVKTNHFAIAEMRRETKNAIAAKKFQKLRATRQLSHFVYLPWPSPSLYPTL